MANSTLALLVALYGLIIGSFINALVWRINTGRSIAKGRSMCPECKHTLAAKDLVPVVSWVVLAGKCRYCSKGISWQYPAVELLTSVLFGLSYFALLPIGLWGWILFVGWLIVLGGLIVLAVYDLRWMILPDAVVLPMVLFWGAILAIGGLSQNIVWGLILYHLIAAFAVGGGFLILATLAKGKLMGGGDVKLGFLMGLLLGLRASGVALFIAFNSAAIIGLALIALKLKTRKDHIPFGPFLVLGTVVAFLYGPQIIAWYLALNGVR